MLGFGRPAYTNFALSFPVVHPAATSKMSRSATVTRAGWSVSMRRRPRPVSFIGTASCGPGVLPPYRLSARSAQFTSFMEATYGM
jgi:hypothetical protein